MIDSTWNKVKDDCSLPDLFGEAGARFVEEIAARKCIHPLAAAMTIVGSMAPLANGAAIRIWSDPSPMCISIVLVNAAQSRKSQTTALVREIGLVLDEVAHARERDRMLKEAKPETDANEVLSETLPSCVLEGFTPEAPTYLRTCLGFPYLSHS